jgi:hypothetical protein
MTKYDTQLLKGNVMSKNLREQILDAIREAQILEMGLDKYSTDHVLFTAQKLSGAPFSFVREIFENNFRPSL